MLQRVTRNEAGDTLVELVVAVVIVAVAFVGILGGMATSVTASDYHHKQALAEGALRNFAEHLSSARPGDPLAVGYLDCASTYPTPAATDTTQTPAGFVWDTPAVSYWDGNTYNPPRFLGGCPGGVDKGLQQVIIGLRSTDGRAHESLTILKRRL